VTHGFLRVAKVSLALMTLAGFGAMAGEGGPWFSGKVSEALHLDWSTTSLHYLHGKDYAFRDTNGDHDMGIVTIEHANGWKYGDNFLFMDISDPFDQTDEAAVNYYMEWHPRLSLSKISGKEFSFGPLKDILLAGEINYNYQNGGFADDSKVYLYGLGFDFAVPGFNYFSLNVYVRDDLDKKGKSLQFSPYWDLPFSIGAANFHFQGFLDYATSEGHDNHANICAQPQLLLDLGSFFGKPNTLLAGTEYSYWHHKYGTEDVNERVWQGMITYKF
jgi:nucleoside-specific outer membrane channel protein Tsx